MAIWKDNWDLIVQNKEAFLFYDKDENEEDNFVVEQSEEGRMLLSYIKNKKIIRFDSRFDPDKKAFDFVSQYKDKIEEDNLIILFGLGMGYTAKGLLKIMNPGNMLVIYEPCYNIFNKTMEANDLTDVIGDNRVKFIVGEKDNVKEYQTHLSTFININNFARLVHLASPGYEKALSEEYALFLQYLNWCKHSHAVQVSNVMAWNTKWTECSLKNSRHIIKSHILNDVKDIYKDRPVIIVSAGPSLDKTIKYLQIAQGKIPIICIYTAYKVLKKNGIKPDMVISVDARQTIVETDENKKERYDTPLFYISYSDKDLLERFDGHKIYCHVKDGNTILKDILPQHYLKSDEIYVDINVSVSAVWLGAYLGGNPLILTGLDLAFPGGQGHATGTFYDNEKYGKDRYVKRTGKLWVDDINGDKILTNARLIDTRKSIERLINNLPPITILDATEGGVLINGTKPVSFKETIEMNISQYTNNGYKPLEVLLNEIKQDESNIKQYIENTNKAQSIIMNVLLKLNTEIKHTEDKIITLMECDLSEDEKKEMIVLYNTSINKIKNEIKEISVFSLVNHEAELRAKAAMLDKRDLKKDRPEQYFLEYELIWQVVLRERIEMVLSMLKDINGSSDATPTILFWDKNWLAVKQMQHSFAFYEEDKDDNHYHVQRSKTGKPILNCEKDNSMIRFESRFDPEKEGAHFTQNFKKEVEKAHVIILFGLGMGYIAKGFLSMLDSEKRLIIYEPSEKIFNLTMEHVDLTEMIMDGRVRFIIGERDNIKEYHTQMGNYINEFNYKEVWQIESPGYIKVFNNEHKQFLNNIEWCKNIAELYKSNILGWNKKWTENALKNSRHIIESYILNDLKNIHADKPIIIVGAGPSLDNNIEYLKSVQGKIPIICVYTAYKALKKHGIKPDFIVTVDARQTIIEAREGKKERVEESVIYICYSDTELIDWVDGYKIYCHTDTADYLLRDILPDKYLKADMMYIDTNVSVSAIWLGAYMGGNPIILTGMDFAFPGGKGHATGTFYDGESYDDKSLAKRTGDRWIDDIHGEKILTNERFENSLRSIERMIYAISDKTVLDATEGGAYIQGTTVVSLKEVAEPYTKQASGVAYNLIEPDKTLKNQYMTNLEKAQSYIINLASQTDEAIKNADELLDIFINSIIADKEKTQRINVYKKQIDVLKENIGKSSLLFLANQEAELLAKESMDVKRQVNEINPERYILDYSLIWLRHMNEQMETVYVLIKNMCEEMKV